MFPQHLPQREENRTIKKNPDSKKCFWNLDFLSQRHSGLESLGVS